MGFKTITVFLLCVALVLTLTNTFTNQNDPIGNVEKAARSVQITQANMTLNIAGIQFGSVSFPNVFSIFGGLVNLIGSLYSLIADVAVSFLHFPPILLSFIFALLFLTFIISVIGWWKGSEAG